MTTGFKNMDRMMQHLERLKRLPQEAAPAVADAINGLLSEQFAGSHDPHGKAWAEHAESTIDRWGEHAILMLTGNLEANTRAVPGTRGVDIKSAPVGRFHQTGTRRMPARPILPYQSKLPPTWLAAIKRAVSEVAQKGLR